MKTHQIGWTLTSVVIIALAVGCGKKEESSASATPSEAPRADVMTNAAAKPVADVLKSNVIAQADSATASAAALSNAAQSAEAKKTAEAAKLAEAASNQLAQANAQATEKANGLIDTIKKLIGESKYQDALKALADLTALKLTPDQQKIVDGLREQINKGLAQQATGGATKALDGLLKKP